MEMEDTAVSRSSLDSSVWRWTDLLTLVCLNFQTSEVGTTNPPMGTLSRLLLPTMAPLVAEGDGPLATLGLIFCTL